jgi:hypothetical protein
VRNEVVNEEAKGLWNSQIVILFLCKKTKTIMESRVEGQSSGANVKSTLIEKEMKQLEKIKFKQVFYS